MHYEFIFKALNILPFHFIHCIFSCVLEERQQECLKSFKIFYLFYQLRDFFFLLLYLNPPHQNFFHASHNLLQSQSSVFKPVDIMFSMIHPCQFSYLFYDRKIHLEILRNMRTSKYSSSIIDLLFAITAFCIWPCQSLDQHWYITFTQPRHTDKPKEQNHLLQILMTFSITLS